MAQLFEWLGNLLMITGVVFMAVGVFGLFRYNDFYARALIASKVDIVGVLFILVGVMLKQEFEFFTVKVMVVLFFHVITNPIATHAIARSAHRTGYRIKKEIK